MLSRAVTWCFGVCFIVLAVMPSRAATTVPAAVKNLSLWYDASDGTTITLSTATIKALADKSGNGATLTQSTLASQPSYTTNSLNGLATAGFNGTSDYLYSTTGFPTASDFTIVFLGRMSGTNANNLLSDYSTSNSTSHAFWGNGGTTPALWTNGTFLTSPSVGTTPFMTVATYSASTNAGAIYDNGAMSAATGTGGSGATDPSIEIGGFNGAGNYLTGALGEAFVYSRILTTTERQELEGYLACKWGLQANLPAAHPDKSACPSGVGPASFANLAVWYDASDASSVTLTTGVTQWTDKSGNGVTLAAPASAAYWPSVTSGAVGGLPAITFSGGQYLYATTGFPVSSNYTIALVALFSAASTNNLFSAYAASGTSHALYGNGGMTPTMYQNGVIVSAASTGTTPFVAVGTSTTGTGAVSLFVNGGSGASAVAGNKTVTDASIEAGGYGGANSFLKGDIAEALVYHSVLSTAERQFIEGYLACKWGLQSSLPAAHPYAATCPTVATASLGLSLAVSPAAGQIPGSLLTYTTAFTNTSATLVYNPVINAPIPAHTQFQIGSAMAALGTTGLAATTTYSSDGGATYAYTPVSGGGGAPATYDANVTNIRWTLSGALAPFSPSNSGSVSYAVAVQ